MSTRRADRKHLFNLVFQIPFYEGIDAAAALARYFEYGTRDTDVDKMFIETSFRGVLTRLPDIDARLQEASEGWDVSRMAKTDLAILRLAAYETMYRADVPTEVAVNEAVELAKAYSNEDAPAFVNGVLAKIVKQTDG